jgi:uncharacterized protein YkwD
MRRISLIVLCFLVAGAAYGTTAASAHRHAHHHAQRYKLCDKHHKRSKSSKRCRRKQHNVGRISLQRNVGQTSGDPSTVVTPPAVDSSTVLPPLPELIAPETACPGQSDESLSSASQEGTMGCMINFARSKVGEASLAGVAPLNDSSDAKASDIVQCDDFSHEACGRAFTYWFQQDGYIQPSGCWTAGENIAWGTGELGTVRSILTAWVYSPEHLENMLSASFDQFGVGLEVGSLKGYPEAHVWVTHFGSLC